MAKQIIITQNDYGISLVFNIKRENGDNYDLTDKNVNASIVFPDNTKKDVSLTVLDPLIGASELLIDKELSKQTGLHKIYIDISDSQNKITSQNMVTYFVLEEDGGV